MAADRRAFSPADGRALPASWHVAHGAHVAACLALLGARGRQAVVQRDAGAVLAALIATGVEPHWLAPGGAHVSPAALDAALTAAPGARAALLAGGAPDVAALVEVAHSHGAALVLDAASHADAVAAIEQGSDLVIVAPAAGAAGAASAAGVGAASAGAGGRDAVAIDATSRFTRRRAQRAVGALLHGEEAERWLPAAAIERAIVRAAGHPAPAAPRPTTAPPAAPRRFARQVPASRPGPTVCAPRIAWMAPQERVAPAAAVGRIAAEALTPDPPGVPAVLPGERIVPDVVATLRAVLDAGGVVHGALDGLATLAVVVDGPR